MSRFNNPSMESAIAFSGTEHDTEIMDGETKAAIEIETATQTPDSDSALSLDAPIATGNAGITVKDRLDSHSADNPFLDSGHEEPTTSPEEATVVSSLESILEDLEGTLPRAVLVDPEQEPVTEGGDKTLLSPTLFGDLMRQQGYEEKQVEHHVTVELDDDSKVELDSDLQQVIDANPETCESLESIIICQERNVHTLIDILKNKVQELK